MTSIPLPSDQPFLYFLTAFLFIVSFYSVRRDKSQLPLINPREILDVTGQKRIDEFCKYNKELLMKGKYLYPGKPFRIFTPDGEIISLPVNFIDEARNHPGLDFPHVTVSDTLSNTSR